MFFENSVSVGNFQVNRIKAEAMRQHDRQAPIRELYAKYDEEGLFDSPAETTPEILHEV